MKHCFDMPYQYKIAVDGHHIPWADFSVENELSIYQVRSVIDDFSMKNKISSKGVSLLVSELREVAK